MKKYKHEPCPYCGSHKIGVAVDTVIGYWQPFCEECGAEGDEHNFKEEDQPLGEQST